MSREIKFRGKVKYSRGFATYKGGFLPQGSWVYGSLQTRTCDKDIRISFLCEGTCVEEHVIVDPETVGQFTGVFDKNGKEIFEGDILRTASSTPAYPIEQPVVWLEEYLCWGVDFQKGHCFHLFECNFDSRGEVIGNIHQGGKQCLTL